MDDILRINDLNISFDTFDGTTKILRNINLSLGKNETLGIVGETGSGKSVLAMSLIGLIAVPGRITSGTVLFDGTDITSLSQRQLQNLRGQRIATILQNPLNALNPVFKVKTLMTEVIKSHQNMTNREALKKAASLLEQVRVPDASNVLNKYPYELSGGMAQRIIIAMAISCRPDLIIADEPTTALDVTVEKQIIHLIKNLREELKSSIIWISHDLEVVKQICQQIAVMYAGEIVETGPARDVLACPCHPYTKRLLDAAPSRMKRGQKLRSISGMMPDRLVIPAGCIFADRCDQCSEICKKETPGLTDTKDGRRVACHATGR